MTNLNSLSQDQIRLAPTLGVIREAALTAMDSLVADYVEGGVGDEVTLAWNTTAFDRFAFVPRVMSGLQMVHTARTFMGQSLGLPVLTSPFGSDGLLSPDGHAGVARANEKFGAASIVPEASTQSWEHIREEAPKGALFAQLHPLGTEENFVRALQRIQQAGYRGVCVTCDCPSVGWKERLKRNDYAPPDWAFSGNYPGPENAEAREQVFGQLYSQKQPVWSWAKLSRLMATTDLPWMAKGVLTEFDAHAALDAGASAIYVSNHGGRQLDRTLSPIDVLPGIRASVGSSVPIAIDSGIRRGSDIVTSLALGADVVVIGRLAAYGLAAGGQTGVERTLELLRDEMENVLMLLGCDMDDLSPSTLALTGAK